MSSKNNLLEKEETKTSEEILEIEKNSKKISKKTVEKNKKTNDVQTDKKVGKDTEEVVKKVDESSIETSIDEKQETEKLKDLEEAKETEKLEKSEKTLIEADEKEQPEENATDTFSPMKQKPTNLVSIFALLLVIFIGILLLIFALFTIYNTFNTNIISGVHIKEIDVSGLSESDAKYQLDNYLKSKIPEEITLKRGDFETTISTSQMDMAFDTKSASHSALQIGREGNIFENNLQVLSMMFGYVNVEPKVTYNKQLLTKYLEDISTQLPDAVVQSSYYIENNELIITSGKEGNVVDIAKSH